MKEEYVVWRESKGVWYSTEHGKKGETRHVVIETKKNCFVITGILDVKGTTKMVRLGQPTSVGYAKAIGSNWALTGFTSRKRKK